MKDSRSRAERRLREQGLRLTRERRAVLDWALRDPGHFDAEQLCDALRREGLRVSRATVYRTLASLVDAGVLRRHPIGHRKVFYEPAVGKTHHEHLVCLRCGEILEFVEEEIEKLQDAVCREHGFEPLRHILQIYGICGACHGAAGGADDVGETVHFGAARGDRTP